MPARKKLPPMRRAVTTPDTQVDIEVVLADLFRHVGMKAQGSDEAKLPTRLKKLEGIDSLPPHVAAGLVDGAPLLANMVMGALDRAGYAVVAKG